MSGATRHVKKEDEEQMALDRFRKASGQLSGLATRVRPDPPDFSVDEGGRRIAVELTRYHHDSGPKGSRKAEHEALEAHVTAKAQKLFEAAHPDLYLLVAPFYIHGSLNRRHEGLYAERLERAVSKLVPPLPTTDGLSTLSMGWQLLEREGLDEVLQFLQVSRARASSRSQWGLGGAGPLSTDVAPLLSIIRDKEADLSRYQASYDDCWLIIYAMPQASAFMDFDVLKPQMFKSTFNRVVIVDIHLPQHFVLVV